MTAAAEPGMTDQQVEDVTLARETSAQIAEVRALIAWAADQAELAAAGGTSSHKAVLWWLVDMNRAIVSWPRTGSRVTT